MKLNSRIYEGKITHARTKPVKHNFSFPIYTFVLDLDELDVLDKKVRFLVTIEDQFSRFTIRIT